MDGDKPKREKFKQYPIGYFHIDMAHLRTQEGKLYLFVAIDRTSKFAVAQRVEKANRKTARKFLEHLLEVVPYKIPTNLTDNGIEFAERPGNRSSITCSKMRFDLICEANGIAHRLSKPNLQMPGPNTARGLGIGRRVLAELEEVARRKGVETLLLETGVYQYEAVALLNQKRSDMSPLVFPNAESRQTLEINGS